MSTVLDADVAPVEAPPVGHKLPAARRTRSSYAVLAVLTALVLVVLAPFLIVVLNAFKAPADFAAHGPLGWPHSLHIKTVVNFWNSSDFGNKLLNSFEISLAVAVLGVLVSLFNAYALGIGRVRGRTAFLVFFLLANVLPQEGLVYPLYYMAKQVGLYDSKWAIVIIFTVVQSAFGTYLLSSVYAAFPRELLEAAQIDGAGTWRTLWRIVVPVSMPTLSVLFTFFFIWTWNEFLLPLILVNDDALRTLPIGALFFQGKYTVNTPVLTAGALIVIAPIVVVYLIFQRKFIEGMTSGATK